MKNVKLKYIKPELVVHKVDNLVSLQMVSENTPPPGPRSTQGSAASPAATNPFETNPFEEVK